ncbi:LysR family transcriptional regulator [Skermania sp. ID1734]|uniref:LysR substrate-binding domain-containing protein n=1 Tax=Skermania sp. ID1734 TaxID=2597516 RepID=UPI00117D7770|nr:LysR substrate-binding domain-containing protein [Skermania sp. ID1734]TSD94079.1 LysR family transcriptional regulator [Skermania sp. ID1734]
MPRTRPASASRPLDLHRLGQFLSVAEHSGFSNAAAQLHISQQALSTSVRQLERHLGVTLFDRSARHVTLTAAGEVLAQGARTLLAAAQALERQTRDAAAHHPRPFVIGHTPAITAEEVFDLIEPACRARPDVSFTAQQLFPDALSTALYEGTIDLALRRGVVTPPDLSAAVIAYHPLRLAVSVRHRLAHRKRIDIGELRDEKMVVWAPPGSSFYTDFIVSTCRRRGFEPDIVVNRVQGTPPVTAVVDSDNIAFVTAPPGATLGGRVNVIELKDPPLVPIQALWLPHNVSAVRNLITRGRARSGRS